MAITPVAATAAAIRSAIQASANGDTLKIASGRVPPFLWPGNSGKTLTIAPQSISNPTIFEGINADGDGSTSGYFAPAVQSPAGSCTDCTFDGFIWEGPRFTSVEQSNGTFRTVRDIPSDGLGGFNWRVDCGYPNVNSLEENAGMTGYKTGQNSHRLTFQNNSFLGFATSLHINSNNLKIVHNDFKYNCEDMLKLWSGDNNYFAYNRCTDFRGVSYYDSVNCWDWGPEDANPNNSRGVPPHADYFQVPSDASLTNLSVISNYLHDETCRIHGCMIHGEGHNNFKVNFNEFRMTHTSGLEITGGITNVQVRGNKVWRIRTFADGSLQNPTGDKNDTKMWWSQGGGAFDPNKWKAPVDNSNNVVREFTPPPTHNDIPDSWTVDDNVTVNSDTTYPDNWIHINRDHANFVDGNPAAGVYGQGGTPPVTAGDPMQDADFNMLGAMPDPNFPSPDTRMTGCLEIPPDSIAYDMPSIWWGDSDDAPLPTVFLGTTTGNAKLYRLQTATPKAVDYHMKLPAAFFGGIYVYYKDADGVMSQKSAVTCRFTTPATADRTVVYVKPRT